MQEHQSENSTFFKIENNIRLRLELPCDMDEESKAEAYRLLLKQAKKYRPLPESAQNLNGALEWPIDPFNPEVAIGAPFNSENFLTMSFTETHGAVDIQGKVGEKVVAPAKIRIVQFSVDPYTLNDDQELHEESLADLTFIVEDPKAEAGFLTGVIAHLRAIDIPESIKAKGNFFDMQSNIVIEKGASIGSIGTFPSELHPDRVIPPKVKEKFGRSHHHIHVAYQLFPDSALPQVDRLVLHSPDFAKKIGGELVDPILVGKLKEFK